MRAAGIAGASGMADPATSGSRRRPVVAGWTVPGCASSSPASVCPPTSRPACWPLTPADYTGYAERLVNHLD